MRQDSAACWHAIYTAPRHEKRVAEQLSQSAVTHYLPLYETVHRWRNMRARLHLPLFPNYLFVRVTRQERAAVWQLPGVQYLVSAGGRPVPLADTEIEQLQHALAGGLRLLPHPYLVAGRRVRIQRGPLEGSEGVLLRRKSNFRVVLSIDLLMRSVAVDVDVADLHFLPPMRLPAAI